MNIANPPRGPATASDTELRTRATAGDRVAFGELFTRHVESVCAHVHWLTAYTVAGNLARDERRAGCWSGLSRPS